MDFEFFITISQLQITFLFLPFCNWSSFLSMNSFYCLIYGSVGLRTFSLSLTIFTALFTVHVIYEPITFDWPFLPHCSQSKLSLNSQPSQFSSDAPTVKWLSTNQLLINCCNQYGFNLVITELVSILTRWSVINVLCILTHQSFYIAVTN